MDLLKQLQKFGLNDKQSKVYLACLQLGLDSVMNISRSARLKRPTTYLILEDLANIGLVTQILQKNRKLYKAEPPSLLLSNLKTQELILDDILPSLNAVYNLDPKKPIIKISEGLDGIELIYKNIFNFLLHNPGEELLIYGSLKDAQNEFKGVVVDYFYQILSKSKNSIREIGNDDHDTRKYFRRANKINPNHHIKLIRREGVFTKSDNMIYGNKLVIFSVKDSLFVITIESPHIVETYKTLFEMAWRSGKPI